MDRNTKILTVIVLAQFCCTSLWFAGNGVLNELIISYHLPESALGHLTSAVQFGFISGTLLFAILTIADRFSPSKIFFVSAVLGSLFNLCVVWSGNSFVTILLIRFLTGFFLAGVYPIGMKIAADYFEKGLNKSLGFLVGALVIGTAFPHLLKDMLDSVSWKFVLIATSALALSGGLMIITMVPDGPFRKPGQKANLSAFFRVFQNREFRSVSFGYFGHMWELYAFWAFVPVLLKTYNLIHPTAVFNIPLWSFLIIGIGGLACVMGGFLAQKVGTKKTAFIALLLSCICCILLPWMINSLSEMAFLIFLLFWGTVVIADSPLFSTLVAQNAPPELKGTALTIVNCIGFSITIISIQLINVMIAATPSNGIYALLSIGPILGLYAMKMGTKTIHRNLDR